MELALSPSTPGLSVGELAELCSFAEEIGYRHAWLAEVAGPDAFVMAAAVAGHTKRMELGVGVVPAYTRTPAVLATAAASVSQLLGGRPFRLGIGTSSEVIVNQWHGLAFERPLTRARETLEAVRAILKGEAGYRGRTVTTNRFRLATAPAGPVPLYVGALRPGMLRLAGQIGDGVCLNLMPPRVVPLQLAEVNKGAAQAGRTLSDDFGVMARLQVLITDDLAQARARLKQQFLGPYLAQPVYNQFLAWMGYQEEAAAIAAGWAAKDREAVARAIHDRLVDDLALVGNVARVKRNWRSLRILASRWRRSWCSLPPQVRSRRRYVRWRHDSEAGGADHQSSRPVRPTSLTALVLMVLATAVSCDSGAVDASTSFAAEVTPPAEIAATVLNAVLEGDTEAAADWTLLDQMPWIAMAEGASIQQAVGLIEEGSRQVAINYWKGFSEGTGLPDLAVGAVQESEVGAHSFASVMVGSARRLRIVLRMEDRWLVDVVASFGSTLAERLRDAIDIIAANRGPDADRLTELISQQRDSISVALESSNLNESARESLEELGAAIDVLGS